jgi:hypothetical protein
MQTPFIYAASGLAALNTIKAAITTVHLVKDIGSTDVYATITGALSIASDTITAGDMSISEIEGIDTLVIAGKNDLTKTGESNKYHTGTATAGTANTITETGQAWVVDTYIRKVAHIKSGTGSGQSAAIISNTADTLTFAAAAFATVPDATSVFEIFDDLSVVYTDGTQIIHAVDESTDKAVSAAAEDTVSVGAANIPVPIVQAKVA